MPTMLHLSSSTLVTSVLEVVLPMMIILYMQKVKSIVGKQSSTTNISD